MFHYIWDFSLHKAVAAAMQLNDAASIDYRGQIIIQ